MALRPDVDLRRSGPERIIFDICNGVIPQLLGIDARALGRFDNPLGERGSNQRSHGGVSLIPQMGPSVIKRLGDHLGLVGVEAGLCEQGSYRHGTTSAVGDTEPTAVLIPDKASREPCGPDSITSVRPA